MSEGAEPVLWSVPEIPEVEIPEAATAPAPSAIPDSFQGRVTAPATDHRTLECLILDEVSGRRWIIHIFYVPTATGIRISYSILVVRG